jgi:hypothetical protein
MKVMENSRVDAAPIVNGHVRSSARCFLHYSQSVSFLLWGASTGSLPFDAAASLGETVAVDDFLSTDQFFSALDSEDELTVHDFGNRKR